MAEDFFFLCLKGPFFNFKIWVFKMNDHSHRSHNPNEQTLEIASNFK